MASFKRPHLRVPAILIMVVVGAASLAGVQAAPRSAASSSGYGGFCADWPTLCVDNVAAGASYIGHDEPSVLFYSNDAGSGNNNFYHLRLPTDPPTKPNQAGTAGTYNFQLHPAFWFGMAMCDSQSAPEYTHTCAPDTDANIFNSPDPNSPNYIGKHPGTAFMEMQFYPPSWAPFQLPGGISCDATKWCAALNIDSLSENMNTGQLLNSTCASKVGIEYVNFAFITKSGVAQAPANPVQATAATYTPNPTKDLFMNSGDSLSVQLQDTSAGFQVEISDITTGQSGSMTASKANGFGQVKFAPTGTTCQNIPYDFHPMYSTSSPNTRVPWAAHSYNVAYSDEIGHFEYCAKVNTSTGTCAVAGASDPGGTDSDDVFCLSASQSLLVKVSGCAGSDGDFDGTPYQLDWPGTLANEEKDELLHPTPIVFTSPLFSGTENFSRVAFESDMPRIERADFGGNCNALTGAHCVNPPPGSNFYPIYTTGTNAQDTITGMSTSACHWREGGPLVPGATHTFGGTSRSEYGTDVLFLFYPTTGNKVVYEAEDFRSILSSNPCTAQP